MGVLPTRVAQQIEPVLANELLIDQRVRMHCAAPCLKWRALCCVPHVPKDVRACGRRSPQGDPYFDPYRCRPGLAARDAARTIAGWGRTSPSASTP
jgi:hypothetical protein